MNRFNKLNKLLQDVKDAELYRNQVCGCLKLKGTGIITFNDLNIANAELAQARQAFEQEKTNLMNER